MMTPAANRVAVQGARVEVSRRPVLGQPRRHEIVLDHRDPAVLAFLRIAGLALGNVAETDLVILVLLSEQGHSRESGYPRGFAGRRMVVADELVVGGQLQRCGTAILDDITHVDHIAAAMKGQGLDHLPGATRLCGGELEHDLIRPRPRA